MASSSQAGQQIDLTTLSTPQLSQLQSRLSQELEHLASSHTRLRAAQSRFRECARCVDTGVGERKEGTEILIPLTTSLYVPGTLSSSTHVLVDVGTGFYVEKDVGSAKKFYEAKVKELQANLGEIERVVGGKEGNLRVVEEVLRGKVLSEQQQEGGQQQQQQSQGQG